MLGSMLIRMLAFCRKELSSSARQPLKLLGLVIGPFIVLAIFAAGYNGKNHFNTILVVPPNQGISTNPTDYKSLTGDTFDVKQVTSDQQAALNQLNSRDADVVIVVPGDALSQVYAGHSAELPVYYRQLNPLLANYIEYNTYVYTSEFDKVLLRESLDAAKPGSQLTGYTGKLNTTAGQLDADIRNNQPAQARLEIVQMRLMTGALRAGVAGLLVPGASATNDNSPEHTLLGSKLAQNAKSGLDTRLNTIDQQLNAVDSSLQNNDMGAAQQNMGQLRQSVDGLNGDINKFAAIPAAVLVEPVLSKAKNLAQTPTSFVNFYSPAVIILLLQHLGVTLSALSIVRDRMLGAVEIFRVAPINPTEILLGKFLSYSFLLLVVSGLLLAALNLLLGVPLVGDPLTVGVVLLISTIGSVGLGFLIAGLSRTETQAVQWSMILILASLFFTGFVVPLNQFNEVVRYVSYLLPMTFGASSLQDVMLDNRAPLTFYLVMPLALGLIYFVIGRFLYKRQFSIG